jgi:hypothetical protein
MIGQQLSPDSSPHIESTHRYKDRYKTTSRASKFFRFNSLRAGGPIPAVRTNQARPLERKLS